MKPFFRGGGGGWAVVGGSYVSAINFKYSHFAFLRSMAMSLSVFNPSLCCLSPFHPVLCHWFNAMSLVGILPHTNRAS